MFLLEQTILIYYIWTQSITLLIHSRFMRFFLVQKFPGVMKTIRDSFGNVTSMEGNEGIGVEMLDWMTRALNIT